MGSYPNSPEPVLFQILYKKAEMNDWPGAAADDKSLAFWPIL
jgi:hypothetical protein